MFISDNLSIILLVDFTLLWGWSCSRGPTYCPTWYTNFILGNETLFDQGAWPCICVGLRAEARSPHLHLPSQYCTRSVCKWWQYAGFTVVQFSSVGGDGDTSTIFIDSCSFFHLVDTFFIWSVSISKPSVMSYIFLVTFCVQLNKTEKSRKVEEIM